MTGSDNAAALVSPRLQPGKKARQSSRAKARKFFLIQHKAHARAKGVELINKRAVFGEGWPQNFHPPGLFDRGFRSYPIRPRYHISKRFGRIPHDIEQHGDYWLVSDRAKTVLSGLGGVDFTFLALDTQVDEGQAPMVFWLCDVMPILDPVDEARSEVVINPGYSGEPIYRWQPHMNLVFIEELVGEHHAFRLKKNFTMIIVDEHFRQSVKDAKLTGLRYQDLSLG